MMGQVFLSSAHKAWIVAEWPGSLFLGENKQQRGCREEERAEQNWFKGKHFVPQEILGAGGKKLEKFLFQKETWIF